MVEKLNRKVMEAKGIYTDTDLCYVFPFKYCNYNILTPPTPEMAGKYIAVRGYLSEVTAKTVNYRSNIQARMQTPFGRFGFCYFGMKPMEPVVAALAQQEVFVCGKLKYDERYGPSIANPDVLCPVTQNPGWFLQYSSFGKGGTKISESRLADAIRTAQESTPLPETIPERILRETGLMGRRDSLLMLSRPADPQSLMRSIQRQIFEDMLYFACCMERDKRKLSPGSQYNVKTCQTSEAIIKNLSYRLTPDQEKVYTTLVDCMKRGIRLTHLVQGDVGYGKSITAFLLMFAIADSGYQSIIMAPTMILAEQHFIQLKQFGDKYGYKVAFLHGGLKAAAKRKIKEGIADGTYRLIVSTHAAISKDVTFDQLALVIIDEEQRFGVKQRQLLREKAQAGVHCVSMTATPIPRTVATSIYGNTHIMEIKTAPEGKLPIQTAVVSDDRVAMRFMKRKIDEGEQGYVICPLINDENMKKELKLQTVKEVAARYEQYLQVPIGVVTGKQKKTEVSEILEKFRKGEIKVLIGTTVLEVGVSVKNANVIVIEDAWMFGLSQLHQLRGRVGRGKKNGYCILQSDRPSEGLQFLTTTEDGFAIAEFDMKMRGGGNLLGEEQTGQNRFVSQAIRFPLMFKRACAYAKDMVDTGEDTVLIDEMEARSEKAYLNFEKLKVYDMSGIPWEQILPKV